MSPDRLTGPGRMSEPGSASGARRSDSGMRILLAGGAGLCVALSLRAIPPQLPAAIAFSLALGLLPGLLIAPLVAPRFSSAGRLLLALTLSPFLAGGFGSVLMLTGLTPPVAARLTLLVLALLALSGAIRAPARESAESSRAGAGDRSLILIAAGWTALMALLLAVNPRLIPRSDGWFHAAVAQQIALRGLPPEDPFFAGLRLLYFWGAHAWAALWIAIDPRLSVWAPLIALNLAGSMATVVGIMLLARRLGATPAAQRWAAGLATLAYAPFAWGWIAARAASGTVRGWPEVERIMNQGIGAALGAMSTGMLHLSMVFFGGKFLVLTPFGLALGLLAAYLIASVDFAERPTARPASLLALTVAGALFVHTFVGLCCLALAAGWWGWVLARDVFIGRRRSEAQAGTFPRPILARLPLSIAAGVAIVSPYLASILIGKEGQLASGLSVRAVVTLIWGGILVVPAGIAWLWREKDSPVSRLLLLYSGFLALAGLLVDPSDNNQSKFFNLLFLLLAAPAGLGWHGLTRRLRPLPRAALAIGLAGAIAPTIALSLWAYAREPGRVLDPGGEAPAEVREALVWARANTPAESVFIEKDGGREAAVLAGRSVLWGGAAWAKKWGYPPAALALREQTADACVSGDSLTAAAAAFIREIGRPVILVNQRRPGAPDQPSSWIRGPSGRRIYHKDGVDLVEIRGSR